jgi:alkylhydroperoxidase/carboxymuconolactone decarboxylase family protein YurZ
MTTARRCPGSSLPPPGGRLGLLRCPTCGREVMASDGLKRGLRIHTWPRRAIANSTRRWVAAGLVVAMGLGGCASIPACLNPYQCTAEEINAQAAAQAQNAATTAAIAAGLGVVAAGAALGAAIAAPAPYYPCYYVAPGPFCGPIRWGWRCW